MKRRNLFAARTLLAPALFLAGAGSAPLAAQTPCLECYADCNGDYRLDVFDFLCFQNQFAMGLSEACDCDSAPAPGVCDIFDFLCFQNRFNRGCDFRPNFEVKSISIPACGLHPGQTFEMTYELHNTGGAPYEGGLCFQAWLSDDCTPGNSPLDILLAGGPSTVPRVLPCQGVRYRWNLRIPSNVLPRNYRVIVIADTCGFAPCWEVCETDERDNQGCEPVTVRLADLGVEIFGSPTPNPAVSGSPVRVPIRVTNHGPGVWENVPVTVCIDSGVARNCFTRLVTVGPCQSTDVEVVVNAPASLFNCGQADPASVTACFDPPIIGDPNPSNNCDTYGGAFSLRDMFYDLRLELVGPPAAVCQCRGATWSVRVRNEGNAPSPAGVRVISGINCNSSCGHWGCTLGQNFRDLPSIAPGGSFTYSVGNYAIWCNAILGTQFIKAEICNNCGTPTDVCPAGNCVVREVHVNPPCN